MVVMMNDYNLSSMSQLKNFLSESEQVIRLLAKTAELHSSPNGAALKKTLERMAGEYGKAEYIKYLPYPGISYL